MNTQTDTHMRPNGRANVIRFLLILGVGVVTTLTAGAQNAPITPAAPAKTTAAPTLLGDAMDASGQIRLMVNKSMVLATTRPYKRVSIGQPEIADVNVVGPTSLLLTAKRPGATQLILWDDADHTQVVDITVYMDLPALQEQVKALFPTSKIEVANANGAVVVKGRVPNISVAEQVVKVAEPYGKVLNFLEVAGGRQVMLQVRFAEVSRSAVSALGINGAFASGSAFGGSNIGQVNPTNLVSGPGNLANSAVSAVNPAVTLYGGGQIGSVYFEVFVDALRQNNLLRVLAEPNLVAISGEEASFLAGGEFPIPVTQGGGSGTGGTAITVEYREFGVKLRFVPVVLGDGRIRLKVTPEVSDLDFTTAVRFNGFVIPGLTQRKVQTTIELIEGQTFAIAGLLNNSVMATKDVTPLLGDLPVVGALFRSVRYQRKETELVVMVTPRLVEAMNPEQTARLPGEKWRHPTESDLFYKQDIGGEASDRKHAATTGAAAEAPRFHGPYGYVPTTRPATAE